MHDQHISSKAEIGRNNDFGRGVIVDDEVVIGDGNQFGDYAVISGRSRIGSGNYVGDHVSIGRIPTNTRIKYEFQHVQSPDKRFGEISIGNDNVIREFTNIGLPTLEFTTIRNGCYIMPHCHIAHDVVLEDRVILSNHCSPGGHTRILEGANLGKGVQVHPRSIIGQYAMLGISTVVIRHILPAVTAVGNPARFLGVNNIGLERNGFSSEERTAFTEILTRTNGVSASSEIVPARVRDIIIHFLDILPESRAARTLPDIDLTTLSLAA